MVPNFDAAELSVTAAEPPLVRKNTGPGELNLTQKCQHKKQRAAQAPKHAPGTTQIACSLNDPSSSFDCGLDQRVAGDNSTLMAALAGKRAVGFQGWTEPTGCKRWTLPHGPPTPEACFARVGRSGLGPW